MTAYYQSKNAILGRRSGLDRRVFDEPDYKGMERRVNEDRRKKTRVRKNPRFRAKEHTLVKLQSESDEEVGQLIDISKDGLALLFTSGEESSPNFSALGVFLFDDDFFVDQIPFRIVSDIELANEIPFNIITYRRYAVKFEELTPEQISKLDHFLLNHTLGET